MRWLLLSLILWLETGHGTTLIGRVVSVQDGDTISLLVEEGDARREERIRFNGIDAPERKQAFGEASRRNLSSLIYGKTVTALCPKVDRYNRRICSVMLDRTDVGLLMVSQGFAWHFKKYMADQTFSDRVLYAEAEEEARLKRKGLWIELKTAREPIAPWDWRADSKLRN